MKNFFVFLFCFITASYAVERRLHIVELQHSFAQPILAILQPHLPAGASANAHDNKLILNVSDAELAQLSPLIETLDQAPLRVKISVRQRAQTADDERHISINGSIKNDEASATIRHHYETERSNNHTEQFVQTLSGQAAFLQTGYEIPYLTFTVQPRSGVVQLGNQFKAVGTGFYVLPRVMGDTATVLINPRQQIPAQYGQYSSRVMETQISGPLGQWISLGGTQQQHHQLSTQRETQWHVEIKIELMP